MKYSELIEKRRHGTREFPIEHYYIDKTHPRYVMALHWHKEFEIIKVRSGRLTVSEDVRNVKRISFDFVISSRHSLKTPVKP